MIKVIDGIDEVGEEVKCSECGAVIHVGQYDWETVYYYKWDKECRNENIDCPNCQRTIYRWEDRP